MWGVLGIIPLFFQVPVNLPRIHSRKEGKKKVSWRGNKWAKKVLCDSMRSFESFDSVFIHSSWETGGAGGKRRSLGSSQAECLCCFWHKITSHVCPFTMPLTSHGEAGRPSEMISSITSMKDDLGSSWQQQGLDHWWEP